MGWLLSWPQLSPDNGSEPLKGFVATDLGFRERRISYKTGMQLAKMLGYEPDEWSGCGGFLLNGTDDGIP